MTSMSGGTASACRWIGLLFAGFMAVPALAAGQEVNTVKSIRAVNSNIEIELQSSKEFPVRNEIVTLRIGKQEFWKSRYPKDGSLKGLIFTMTADEFEKLADGETMTVAYGKQGSEEEGILAARDTRMRWDFGKLNKTLLER